MEKSRKTSPVRIAQTVLFIPGNNYDGVPIGTKKVLMHGITDIRRLHILFKYPMEEKLDLPLLGYNHMLWEGDALHFNDTMMSIMEESLPEHWSWDEGGIMGHVVLFNK